MREIQMHPPGKKKPFDVVRRLEFFANGAELLAWVGPERFTYDGRDGFTRQFHLWEFATNSTRELCSSWWLVESAEGGWGTFEPLVSRDHEYVVYESTAEFEDGVVWFEELGEGESGVLPRLQSCRHGLGGAVLTLDDAELIAVRNIYEGVHLSSGHWAPDVVRFDMASLKKSPVRYEVKTNPLTYQSYRSPIYDVRWEPVMSLPHRKVGTIGLSADGKLLAVADSGAGVNVFDLTRKELAAEFPWKGRFLRDGKPVRIGFDPAAKWVAMLANGRLFVRHIGADLVTQWQTKKTLGYVHDFAYHPTGRVLCAVFRDGQARYLDPHTGKVQQSFKWLKKPTPLYSVAFSPDGLTCAAGGENGKVILWDVDV